MECYFVKHRDSVTLRGADILPIFQVANMENVSVYSLYKTLLWLIQQEHCEINVWGQNH